MKIVKPESVGLSAVRLKSFDDMLMNKYIGLNKLAGTQTLIARKGEIAHFHSQGNRDIEKNLPINEDTLFRIYSMTKPVTGVALMQLLEQGLFQLSDPVSKFLPEFNKIITKKDQEFAVICRTGSRTSVLSKILTKQLGQSNFYNVKNGITHWIREGNPVKKIN